MYIRKPNKVSNLSVGAAVPMSFKLEIQVHEHYNLSFVENRYSGNEGMLYNLR